MKWFKHKRAYIPDGKLETVTGFAWLPITIDDETRWLERVTVEYQWFAGYLTALPCWTRKRFL